MNAEHTQGTNSGTVHGCAFSEGGCTDHICIVTIAKLSGELAEVEALLRAVSDTQLEGLAAQHERLRINRDRNTIQLLGCEGRVLLNVARSPMQVSDLTALH